MYKNTSITKYEKETIFKEVQNGILKTLKDVHKKYINFHWCSICYEKTGDTVLHVAARLGFPDIILYLVNNFVPSSVDCKNNDDKTPLHEACQFSQYESCKKLIENGANVNAIKRADWTPLMLACTKICPIKSYNIVTLLLQNESIVNYKNKDGWSVLHLICREGDVEIFNLLLTFDLDILMKTKNGRSGLHVACLHGNLEIVKILLNLNKQLIDDRDNCGNTPMHEAVLSQNLDLCRFLINNGADVSCRNMVGFSLLHLAASEGSVNMIKFLVVELKFDVNEQTKQGFTSLHCAARKNKRDIYNYLVEHIGCNVDILDNYNRKAVDYFT